MADVIDNIHQYMRDTYQDFFRIKITKIEPLDNKEKDYFIEYPMEATIAQLRHFFKLILPYAPSEAFSLATNNPNTQVYTFAEPYGKSITYGYLTIIPYEDEIHHIQWINIKEEEIDE